MTREEQKKIADFVRTYIHEIITESGADKNAHTNEVLRKVAEGIEALSAEPCEDAISRADTIEWLKKVTITEGITFETGFKQILTDIQNMPSTTPKQSDALEQIRAEIKEQYGGCGLINDGLDKALFIIDKYMAESED